MLADAEGVDREHRQAGEAERRVVRALEAEGGAGEAEEGEGAEARVALERRLPHADEEAHRQLVGGPRRLGGRERVSVEAP